MTSRDRNLADRGGHVVDRDLEKTFSDLFEALAAYCVRDPLQPRARRLRVERLVAVRSEYRGEMCRIDAAQEKVAIGDRQRATVAVAGGPGVRGGRFRANAKAHSVEAAN